MNNTIVVNEASPPEVGGGIYLRRYTRPVLRNNIIVNNSEGEIIAQGSKQEVFYNNIWNNTPNNYNDLVTSIDGISVNPLFVNPDSGDFRLQPGSPCIDAGDPTSPLDADGTIADLGAFPTYHFDTPCIWLINHQLVDEDENGRVDAGETANLIVTLKNTSFEAANGTGHRL